MKRTLRNSLVTSILVVATFSLGVAFAGEVVVQEGDMDVENLNVNEVLEVTEDANVGGGLTVGGNITTTGTGFFGQLGSSGSKIEDIFVKDTHASGYIGADGDVNIGGSLIVRDIEAAVFSGLGPEEVTCLDFDCTTGWEVWYGDWSISTLNGIAIFDGEGESQGVLKQDVGAEAGIEYTVKIKVDTFDCEGDCAGFWVDLGNTSVGEVPGVGTYTWEHVEGKDGNSDVMLLVECQDCDPGSSVLIHVDYVSVKEEIYEKTIDVNSEQINFYSNLYVDGDSDVNNLEVSGDVDVVAGEVTVTGPAGVVGEGDAPDVLTVTGGNGASSTISKDGGGGGSTILTGGTGGTGGNFSVGWAGGKIALTSGAGGTSEEHDSGKGGNIELTTGAGGECDGEYYGGAGGDLSLTGGTGGRSDEDIGGAGGNITLTSGAGGDAGMEDGTGGGDSGNIELTVGAPGTGPYNGSYGNMHLAKNGGNVGVGTTNFGASANKVVSIGAGTAPTAGATNACQIYATGANAELYVMDEAGNATQISPHDKATGEWIYYSVNVRTGRVVRVNMEKLVKAVEKLTGEKLMMESYVE